MKMDFPDLDEVLLSWCGAGQWQVLGRRLRPLTMLHQELLRQAGSGLLTGRALSLPELYLVARICSLDPWEAGKWLTQQRGGWRERVSFFLTLLWWWRQLPQQWERMREYLEATNTPPEMMVKESSGKAGERRDAPPFLDVWTVLVEAGFPWREVVGVWPAGLGAWLYEILASRQGGRKFVTEDDRELMERARQMRAMTDPEPKTAGEVAAVAARMRRSVLTRRAGHGDRQFAQQGVRGSGCSDPGGRCGTPDAGDGQQ